ncbi:allatostatin-A receptor isoform X3 [Malaya genurostris]|uniref:allatostatin-A receptor isoform X3 n=1 Tax=Malaya genurostris TaxID=325434 RepID=UPI0026F39961|nr:allatostatin-A receptor isoform X3 [Malaya genurostris]
MRDCSQRDPVIAHFWWLTRALPQFKAITSTLPDVHSPIAARSKKKNQKQDTLAVKLVSSQSQPVRLIFQTYVRLHSIKSAYISIFGICLKTPASIYVKKMFSNASWTDTFASYNETMRFHLRNATSIEKIVSTMVPVFFGIIGLAGLIGNGLVVLVVAANPSMRSTTNLLIINLAAADLLFVIFCVPFTATDYVLPEWPFGLTWCKFVQYMIVATAHASAYTLVLMSLDRFLAVVHPITSMSVRTEKNAVIAIAIAWLIIITTAIPVAVSHGVLHYPSKGIDYTACLFLHTEGYNLVAFHVSFFLSSYVIPLSLISMLYVGMLIRLWKGAPGGRVSAESRRGKKRVTRMVVIVVLAFAACWFPIQVVWCGKPPSLLTLGGPQTKTTRTGNGTSNPDGL